jgi:manganese oxidase
MRLSKRIFLLSVLGFLSLAIAPSHADTTAMASPSASGVVRTYYIAADIVTWDYAPRKMNVVMGTPFSADEAVFTVPGKHRIGSVYRKVMYREYTDATFRTLKPRPPDDAYLGILGPTIHAEVGDTIKVIFRNNADRPYSMHPHGVLYKKDSEGMAYNDGSAPSGKEGGAVPPGQTYTYTWEVPESAGPGPNDPSSIGWLYHSHVNDQRDVDSGLVGAIIVTRQGMARADGTPKDVDREVVTVFNFFDENQSWYLNYNIHKYTRDPQGTMKDDVRLSEISVNSEGLFSLAGSGFVDSNLKASINGYLYANGPAIRMKQGQHVRWYVMSIGNGFNFHTPHWHGNTVLVNGQRTDVIFLGPANMVTADMVPDDPGTWLFHCHISDHMEMGMSAFYQVDPVDP